MVCRMWRPGGFFGRGCDGLGGGSRWLGLPRGAYPKALAPPPDADRVAGGGGQGRPVVLANRRGHSRAGQQRYREGSDDQVHRQPPLIVFYIAPGAPPFGMASQASVALARPASGRAGTGVRGTVSWLGEVGGRWGTPA